ncbi:MAG: hypothetical protein IJN74_03775 [Clostridia bacterium]|nr:hypothetical protein [Clostridia bacterium]
MRLADLRLVTQSHTTIWLTDAETHETIQVNELRFIDGKYDECNIELMFPEKYPSISSYGLTVYINQGGNENE